MAGTRPMGIGVVGAPDTNLKLDFRFTFEIYGFCGNQNNRIPEHFCTVAARPNRQTDEIQIDFLHARTWIPGKTYWETIQVTYLDAAHAQMQQLWNWLATVSDLTDPVGYRMGSKRDWDATGLLTMYDGCGSIIETWELQHMFPQSVDFGTVDHSSNEICKIEMTLRYSDVKYRSYCPGFTPESCCTPCRA